MSFGSNPADPSPWAEATGHAPVGDESSGGPEPESPPPGAPPPVATAVCAPGSAAPCVTCQITSETAMTEPADRARRNLGVGERVKLTFSLGNANWRKS